MERSVYVGMVGVRDKAYIKALPMRNDSGLWQAWKMDDGNFLIQPLDFQHAPWGSPTLLESEKYCTIFAEVHTGEMPGQDAGTARIHADSPDLLTVWYHEAIGCPYNSPTASKPAPAASGKSEEDDILALFTEADALAALQEPEASNAADLSVVWHPDHLFLEEESLVQDLPPAAVLSKNGMPAHSAIQQPSADTGGYPLTPKAAFVADSQPGNAQAAGDGVDLLADLPDFTRAMPSPSSLFDNMPPLSLEAPPVWPDEPEHQAPPVFTPPLKSNAAAELSHTTPQPTAGTPGTSDADGEAYAEERIKRLEASMRSEFETLVAQLDESAHPAVENEISRLIQRGTGFTWKQKYMFTEFGLTLRRKQKHTLALACHMRALSFSPHDEHVLFNVARAEYELGNIEEAKNNLRHALKSAPGFTAAKNFLTFLGAPNSEKKQ